MSEERQTRIGPHVELERHAHVAETAACRYELGPSGGRPRHVPARDVDDEIRDGQPLDDGPESGRLVVATKDRVAGPRIVETKKRRRLLRQRRPAAEKRDEKREYTTDVHDEVPVRPHFVCGAAHSGARTTSSWTR